MARKKVKLAWIANDSARKATFKKRRKGLMKKVKELSILCDVKACAIVYGPDEKRPEVWPSEPETMRVLSRFKSMPEMEKSKKMMNQEGFLRQRMAKLQEQLHKLEKENREAETKLMMFHGLAGRSLHDLRIEDVTCLAWILEIKAKAVQDRLDLLTGRMQEMMLNNVAPPPPLTTTAQEKKPQGQPLMAAGRMEEVQAQDWFMKMMMMNPLPPPPPPPNNPHHHVHHQAHPHPHPHGNVVLPNVAPMHQHQHYPYAVDHYADPFLESLFSNN
ncbi:hypothetical protein J5N97_002508 [Dioscorea zingiberensis]|uniref:MADS-box domain-containing protein n=1 Tax=Dioscorea zingiberensis TaxID=325984 RepID=A0A9D5HQF8_9LILI|nr:hypothetical protein J5N97_002508 [Dioscorea zingiberensis]